MTRPRKGNKQGAEIILRPHQFCNLTEVVIRPEDTVDSIRRKVEIAAILGTIQSSFTNFPYLRKIWKKNTEEERLLGVSLTGIYDNPLTYDPDPNFLEELKHLAVRVNKTWAEILGIEPSMAVCCIKPSGTVSQLVNAASGIHPRWSKYYIRRVRNDNKDPLTNFMIQQGVPAEPALTSPNQTTVFSFPQKAPDHGVTRDDITALDHLGLWKTYRTHWCEHNPSITVNVREHEWLDVGAFVWQNMEELGGVSFLPYDNGSYKNMQPPYEAITKEEYDDLVAAMPTHVDWDSLIEDDDNVEGVQTLACTGNVCEINL